MISTHHGTSSRRQDAELATGMELATRDDDVDAVDDPGRSRSVSPESLERRNGWFGCWQYMGNIWGKMVKWGFQGVYVCMLLVMILCCCSMCVPWF